MEKEKKEGRERGKLKLVVSLRCAGGKNKDLESF